MKMNCPNHTRPLVGSQLPSSEFIYNDMYNVYICIVNSVYFICSEFSVYTVYYVSILFLHLANMSCIIRDSTQYLNNNVYSQLYKTHYTGFIIYKHFVVFQGQCQWRHTMSDTPQTKSSAVQSYVSSATVSNQNVLIIVV